MTKKMLDEVKKQGYYMNIRNNTKLLQKQENQRGR